MLRKIGGIVIGYGATIAFMIGTYTALYAILGFERSYRPNSWEVSTLWVICTLILGFFGSVFGGFLCKAVSKDNIAVQVFAAVVFLFGIVMGIGEATSDKKIESRTGPVISRDDMQKSRAPIWVGFLNPVIGAIGILVGGRIRKEK